MINCRKHGITFFGKICKKCKLEQLETTKLNYLHRQKEETRLYHEQRQETTETFSNENVLIGAVILNNLSDDNVEHSNVEKSSSSEMFEDGESGGGGASGSFESESSNDSSESSSSSDSCDSSSSSSSD